MEMIIDLEKAGRGVSEETTLQLLPKKKAAQTSYMAIRVPAAVNC
jgi:hypothetical protein